MEEQATDTTRFRRVVYERPLEADKVDPELSLEQLGERRAKISRLISEIAESFDSIRGQLESDRASEDPEWGKEGDRRSAILQSSATRPSARARKPKSAGSSTWRRRQASRSEAVHSPCAENLAAGNIQRDLGQGRGRAERR
jgi:hypothetical protein